MTGQLHVSSDIYEDCQRKKAKNARLKSSLRTSLECSLASEEVLALWMVALWPPMTWESAILVVDNEAGVKKLC